MDTVDLVIKGGTLADGTKADVGIKGQHIVELSPTFKAVYRRKL